MKLIYLEDKKLFLCKCSYFQRRVPRDAGFNYSSKSKLWYTQSPDDAIKLYKYADDELQKKFDQYKRWRQKKIKQSTKASSDFNVPKPEGLEHDYFPYQKAGIEYAMNRKYTLIADDMGCIDGEAKVAINRSGGSKEVKLKDIYKRTKGLDKKNWNWDTSTPTYVRSLCNDGYFRLKKLTNVIYQGYKECIKINLNNGKELSLTPDHLVKTDNGWVEIGKLSKGDEIYTNGKLSCKRCGSTENVSTYKYAKSKITSIESVGKKDVYDLTIEDTHNFIANNTVVHNCGKTIQAIGVLNKLNESKDINRVMILCPNTMKGVWKQELKKWMVPDLCMRVNNSADFELDEIMITNYEAFRFQINPNAKGFRDPKKGKYNNTLEIFKDLRKMDNIDLLVLDECFTPDTEILTEDGFVKFDDLQKDKKVAQFDNGEISFVKPTKYIKRNYNGKLVHLHRERGIDLKMTPHHEMIMWNKRLKKYQKKECDNISFNSNYHFPVAGKNLDGENDLSPYEKLVITIQADGSLHNKSNTSYDFQFSKERKINVFLSLMENGNFDYNEVKGFGGDKNKNSQRRFIITNIKPTSKNIYDYFKISQINYKKARSIIEYMVKWDGHVYDKNKYYYSSTDEEAVNFYQTIATIAGYKTHKNKQVDQRKESYNDVYRLYIQLNSDYTGLQGVKKEYIDYNGKVYCVRVPKENIIVRRNGKVMVTGNSHRIKNYSANTTRNVFKLKSQIGVDKALFLTGTPIFSRPDEIWTTIKFFDYEDKFKGTKQDFVEYYQDAYFDTRYKRMVYGEPKHLDELQRLLRTNFMIRRTKEQVFDEMPDKIRKIVPIDIDESAFDHLDGIIEDMHNLSSLSNEDEIDPNQNILSSLRTKHIDELAQMRMITGQQKISATVEYVQELIDAGEKVIIFGHHKKVLGALKKKFPNCAFITGDTPSEDRVGEVEKFQNDDDCMVFIGNMQSAGVGITLTASSHVVFVEMDFVPANMIQAEDRAYRYGQDRTVFIHLMVAENTLDPYIANMIIDKQEIFDKMIEHDKLKE